MNYVTKDEIININKEIGEGGVELISTLSGIVYKEEEQTNIIEASIVLLEDMPKLHPFVNGNKRTAFYSFILLLEKNGYKLRKTPKFNIKISRIMFAISHGKAKKHQVARFIKKLIICQ